MQWDYTLSAGRLAYHDTHLGRYCFAAYASRTHLHRRINPFNVRRSGMVFCCRHGSGHGGDFAENTLVKNRISRGSHCADSFHDFYPGIPPNNTISSPRDLLLYSVIPLAAIIVTVTNDWHGLIWNSFTYSPTEPNSIIYGHGSGFYVLIAYDYMIVLLGLAVMIHAWFQSKQPYRRQISMILFSSIFPFIIGLAYIFGWNLFPGLDITPISFLMTGLILALGVIQFGLFDLAPIARHLLIENMNDGILVLDSQDRIVDINPIAEISLPLLPARCSDNPFQKFSPRGVHCLKELRIPMNPKSKFFQGRFRRAILNWMLNRCSIKGNNSGDDCSLSGM